MSRAVFFVFSEVNTFNNKVLQKNIQPESGCFLLLLNVKAINNNVLQKKLNVCRAVFEPI